MANEFLKGVNKSCFFVWQMQVFCPRIVFLKKGVLKESALGSRVEKTAVHSNSRNGKQEDEK